MIDPRDITARIPSKVYYLPPGVPVKDEATGVMIEVDEIDPSTAIVTVPGRYFRSGTRTDDQRCEVARRIAPYSDLPSVEDALATVTSLDAPEARLGLLLAVALSDVAVLQEVEGEVLDALDRLRAG